MFRAIYDFTIFLRKLLGGGGGRRFNEPRFFNDLALLLGVAGCY